MGRTKATVIIFHRVEGYAHECVPVTFTGADCWENVERHILRVQHTAPTAGYDKCAVQVTFADGYVYRTRYDMQHPDAGNTSLTEHVRREWLFYALRWCPSHMTQERQVAFLEMCNVSTAAWSERCDTYDVPGLAPPNAQTLQWIPTVRGGGS